MVASRLRTSSTLTEYAFATEPVFGVLLREKRASALEVEGDAHACQDSLGACGLPGSRQDLTGGACGVGGEGVAHRDAASGLGCAVVDQSLHEAVHLGLLPTRVGESGLRGRRSARVQADVPEAQGEVRELCARAGREAVGGFQPGTPEGAEAQLRVSEGRTSNESQMR